MLDVDLCGPSVAKVLGMEGKEVSSIPPLMMNRIDSSLTLLSSPLLPSL